MIDASMFFDSHVAQTLHPQVSAWMSHRRRGPYVKMQVVPMLTRVLHGLIVYCVLLSKCVNFGMHFVRTSLLSHAVKKPWWHACRIISFPARVFYLYRVEVAAFPMLVDHRSILLAHHLTQFCDGTRKVDFK